MPRGPVLSPERHQDRSAPLRGRREDIPLLAMHFIGKYARPGGNAKQIAPDAMQILLCYSWPGNIRELKNAIEPACVTCAIRRSTPKTFPPIYSCRPSPTLVVSDRLAAIARRSSARRHHADRARLHLQGLAETRGRIGQCARICQLSRRSMTAKLNAYQIDREFYKRPEQISDSDWHGDCSTSHHHLVWPVAKRGLRRRARNDAQTGESKWVCSPQVRNSIRWKVC